MGERLLSNLVSTAAESLPIGSYIYLRGLDGTGVYRVTRVLPEHNQVYGMLIDKEPLDKPWWRYNLDEGVSSCLPLSEWREVPQNKKKKRSKKKSEYAH